MLRWTKWLLGGAAVAGQCVALYRPSGPPSQLAIPGLDKIAHLIIFALPVFLILLALRRSVRSIHPASRRSPRSLSLSKGVIAIFAAHAVISEIIQGTLYRHRTGDPLDVLADFCGIALGGVAFVLVARRGHGRTYDSAADQAVAP